LKSRRMISAAGTSPWRDPGWLIKFE
jgi:hypothetical protein